MALKYIIKSCFCFYKRKAEARENIHFNPNPIRTARSIVDSHVSKRRKLISTVVFNLLRAVPRPECTHLPGSWMTTITAFTLSPVLTFRILSLRTKETLTAKKFTHVSGWTRQNQATQETILSKFSCWHVCIFLFMYSMYVYRACHLSEPDADGIAVLASVV